MYGAFQSDATTSTPQGSSGGGFFGGFLDTLNAGFETYINWETLEYQRDIKLAEIQAEVHQTQAQQDPRSAAAQASGGFLSSLGKTDNLITLGLVAVGVVGVTYILKKL